MSAQGMPPHLLALFAPRPPLDFIPPVGGLSRCPQFTGIADLVSAMEDTPPPPPSNPNPETPQERKARLKKEALKRHWKEQDKLIEEYEPHKQECATKDPYRTLFIARLSYETTERRLRKEFERYGPIKALKIITDKEGRSRGYAFIEYQSEVDMRLAYKRADGTKIDGRRVLVDVERSRTVENWLPRRLGGGKGKPRGHRPPPQPQQQQQQQQQQQPPPVPPSNYSHSHRGYSNSYHGNNYHHNNNHHYDGFYNRRPMGRKGPVE